MRIRFHKAAPDGTVSNLRETRNGNVVRRLAQKEGIVELIDQVREQIGAYSQYVLPVLILFVGWLLSLVFGWAMASLIRRTGADRRLSDLLAQDEGAPKLNLARTTGSGAYWLGLLITVVAVLHYVKLEGVAAPLNALISQVLGYLPHAAGAAIILIVAWIVARLLRYLIVTALSKTTIDETIHKELGSADAEAGTPPSKTLGNAVYWLVILLALPAALGALKLEGLLEPVEGMFAEILGFLPNLIAAAAIFLVGWFVARLVQRIVANLLSAAGIDRLSDRVGVQNALGKNKLSDLLGVVAHILIVIPVAIMALDALNIEAITRPASQMLAALLNALPALFGAGLVLVISFFIGRVVAELFTNLLHSAGFDNILVKLGVTQPSAEEAKRKPSAVGGDIVMIAIMLFAFIEASGLLGFSNLADLTAELLVLGGHILLGLAIFALGLYLSKAAANAIEGTQIQQNRLLAVIARIAILILAGAMGLQQFGLANEIVSTAFAVTLSALGIAFALAFGLGGREEAAEQLREWRNRIKANRDE